MKDATIQFGELMTGMFDHSRVVVLDFNSIPDKEPEQCNMQRYFNISLANAVNPLLPENRQAFNDRMLDFTNMRFLIGQYAEDRRSMLEGSEIASQGRTLHLGIDIFTKQLEAVFSPCNGVIIRAEKEEGNHSFGNYVIIKPDDTKNLYIFLGHLSKEIPKVGAVRKGQKIAIVGDYSNHENGGWSRHVHLQLLRNLPAKGYAPIGYYTKGDFEKKRKKFPDPKPYFSKWNY